MASTSTSTWASGRQYHGHLHSPPRADPPRRCCCSRSPPQRYRSPPEQVERRVWDSNCPLRCSRPEVFQSSTAPRGRVCVVCLGRHEHIFTKCKEAKLWDRLANAPQKGKTVGCNEWSPTLLRLADPKGLQLTQPPRSTQVLQMWKIQSWGSRMPSSTEGVTPSPPTTRRRGQSSSLGWIWMGDTLIWFRVSWRVSMWECHGLKRHISHPIMPPSFPTKMYIVKLSIVSLRWAATSTRSHVTSWSGRWAPSKPPPCPLCPKHRIQVCTWWCTIFPTCTYPPQMPHQSTHTLTAMISHAPGAPSRPLPYSLPISPQAPRLLRSG